MTERTHGDVTARLKALLSSGDYSDLKITCGLDAYNVHKAIVCPQSSFFKNAEKFPVGKEAEEGRVHLPEDDPHAVKLLVQYFYESEYDPQLPKIDPKDETRYRIVSNADPKNNAEDDGFHYRFPHTCKAGCEEGDDLVCHHHICQYATCDEKCVNFICEYCTKHLLPEGDATQLLLHTTIYEIADKYDVTGLKLLAKEKFSRSCEAFWDTEHLATAAEHALTTTPDSDAGLRQALCKTLVQHIELLEKPPIAALLSKHAGFAYGVLRQLAGTYERLK
ncbi:hypothetical protein J4E93_008859 [Alternaria ventricosa]|uniref:uncharacterized protein n=1 Tax=Alternaria ventricosa TaxID=1187951 RepID=UPI0020C50050|nr:uncharacterized protein J4E93_008859 [Alternaria ventricosa]KAI4640059.1 hypothetical protein J4E93_008859 [Alternaria ventricosa]